MTDSTQPTPGTNPGHVWPRPDGRTMRCGGPGVCSQCDRDAGRVALENTDTRIARMNGSAYVNEPYTSPHGALWRYRRDA